MSPTTLSAAPLSATDTGPEAYAFTQCVPGHDVIFAEPTLRASQVKARIQQLDPKGHTSVELLAVFADTFVLDDATFGRTNTLIVARVVDVTATAVAYQMPANAKSGLAAVQLLFQYVKNGALAIVSRTGQSWTLPARRQPSSGPLVVTSVHEADFETTVWPPAPGETAGPINELGDVAKHPQVWNLLKSQFAAACLHLDEPAGRAEALAKLEWVAQCTTAIATQRSPLVAEACQLNYQTSALLLFNSGSAASRYVPAWSEGYLKGRIDDLLSVLRGYEDKMRTLEIKADVKSTVEALSRALRDVAEADDRALAATAKFNLTEIEVQQKQYGELLWAYEMQEHAVALNLILFRAGLKESATIKMTIAVLQLLGAVVQMGAAAYGAGAPDPKAGADAAQRAAQQEANLSPMFVDAGSWAKAAAKTAIVKVLAKLKSHLVLSMKVGKSAAKALKRANEIDVAAGMTTRGTIEIPELAEMSALDPEMDWNILIVELETMMEEFMSDRDGSGAVKGAREYFISVRTLTEYGRALSLKSVAIARLQARALELAAQRNAARYAVERWTALQLEAKTAEEKLNLCRALILEAALNTKRSLLIMGDGYRAAYAYNHLNETPMRLRLTMDYAAMNDEFRSIKNDIDSLYVPTRMQETTTGFFELPVVHAMQTSNFPTTPHAVLRIPASGKPILTWTTPIADPPFERWLPPGRRFAYFLEEARFYLDGAEPDAKGVISMWVTTSGHYENGHGAAQAVSFISQGVSLNFGYEPKAGAATPEPFTPWRPVGKSKETYMSPTPFTSWIATIDRAGSLANLKTLRLKFWLQGQSV